MSYTTYTPLALISVRVSFKDDVVIKDYTAKLVKTLLINGNPRLEELFSKGRGLPPKPIHITPLYATVAEGGRSKKEAIYTRYVAGSDTVKPPPIEKLKPVKIQGGKEYLFYTGVSLNLLNEVLAGLSNVGRLSFGRSTVYVDNLKYEVSYLDVGRKVEEVRKALNSSGQLKAVFESPTLLRDPLTPYKSRFRLLVPLPEAVLAVPLLMCLLDLGRYRLSLFIKLALCIRSSLSMSYSATRTTRVIWYVYDGKLLPAMVGYVKYYLNTDAVKRASVRLQDKYNLDFLDIIAKAIAISEIYGVGSGRASGFGHSSWHIARSSKDSLADENLKTGKPSSENF